MVNETLPARHQMTPGEIKVSAQAVSFARANKKAIGTRRTNQAIYPPEEAPVSVFMAGSPGAGKTEASIALLNLFADTKILRIDPDELRNEFSEYSGANSWLFQGGVSILVEKILDFALDQRQSFLLDGTFSNIDVARKNVERSLKKGRFVQSCTSIKIHNLPGALSKPERKRRAEEFARRISSISISQRVTL